jgi:hypothetical protein
MANLPLQLGQQPNNIPAALAPPVLQGPRAQNFSMLFQDPTLDPCQGDYTRIMERFNPNANPGLSHVMLLEQATSSGPIPQAYLCCATKQNQTRVYCLHSPSKYTSALDGLVTLWDGLSFMFVGDVTQGQATTILLPNKMFRLITTRAKTTDYIVTHLDELADYGMPPSDANDPEANQVSTRSLMYPPMRMLHYSSAPPDII